MSLEYNDITSFNNDKYLFIKYGEFKFDIYNIKENIQSINSKNEDDEIDSIHDIDINKELMNNINSVSNRSSKKSLKNNSLSSRRSKGNIEDKDKQHKIKNSDKLLNINLKLNNNTKNQKK